MDEAKKKRAETLAIVGVAVWATAALLYAHFEKEIDAALWIMAVFPAGALLLTGLFLIVWAIIGLVRSRGKSRSDYAVLATVAATIALLHFGVPATLRWRLDTRPRLAAHLAAIQKLPRYKWDGYCRHNGCEIDPDAPKGTLRVSFPEPGGILDNYTAVIYDPTGAVMQANRYNFSNWNDPAFAKVKRMFGGDLVWAEPLGGGWYRCGFT